MDNNHTSTSEYRGAQKYTSQYNVSESHSTRHLNPTTESSYANAAKKPSTIKYPEREQAIIMNYIEELKLTDYVMAVSKIIGPRNITFASRISNDRICLYLSNTDHVDNLIINHNTVTIADKSVTIRRLITPARRIILSNVSPTIPNETLEEEIKNMGLTILSPVSFLKASVSGEEFSHIMSFRRQVYVNPDKINILPPSKTITYKDISYRIFISMDEIICFSCNQAGHVARKCPNHTEITPSQRQTDKQPHLHSLVTDTPPPPQMNIHPMTVN